MKAKSETCLNEKDTFYDILEDEKQLLSLYATALFEGNGKQVRSCFSKNLDGVALNQYTIYSQMLAKGFLPEPAPAVKDMIDTANENFKKIQKSLEC